ncbi:transmembrane 9 superfamily member 4-like protein [Tanacetum coccineum]
MLNGDRLASAPYKLEFLVDKDSEVLCSKKLSEGDVSQLRSEFKRRGRGSSGDGMEKDPWHPLAYTPYVRGVLWNALVIAYAVTSVVSGYTSVSFYCYLDGTTWFMLHKSVVLVL